MSVYVFISVRISVRLYTFVYACYVFFSLFGDGCRVLMEVVTEVGLWVMVMRMSKAWSGGHGGGKTGDDIIFCGTFSM